MSADPSTSPASEPKGGPAPSRRRASVRRTPRRAATRSEGEPSDGRFPWLLSPPFFLVLGALLTACFWLVMFNPEFGTSQQMWPWELFREQGPEGGPVVWRWNPETAAAIAGGFFALFLLVAALLPSGRARGGFALFLCALAFTSYLEPPPDVIEYAGMLSLGALGGALLARGLARRGRKGRALLFLALVLAAGHLLLPRPQRSLHVSPVEEYDCVALAMTRQIREAIDPSESSPVPARDLGALLRIPAFALDLVAVLLFAAGLLSLLGISPRFMGWAGGILLLLMVLGPAALRFWEGHDQPLPYHTPLQNGLMHAAEFLPMRYLAFLLPLAAGVAELGSPRRAGRAPVAS